MTRTVLAVVGGLAVIGLLAAAGFGLALVKDRITLVVQAEADANAPSPTALLRDDVAALRSQVEALQQALATNFEQLGTALDENSRQRHEELRAALGAVSADSQRARQDGSVLAKALAELRAAVDSLQVRAVPEQPAVANVPTEVPVAAAEGAPPVAPTEEVADPAPTPAPEAPAAQPKRTGFLSFSLPTSTFRFGDAQDFALVPELSRVGFDAKSTLHDFTGVTTKVWGDFRADLDDPAGAWTGRVACKAATLVTGIDGRDENLREHLATAEHPDIVFTIVRFEPARIEADKEQVAGVVHGQMTIRGVTKDVQMPIEVKVDASKRLVIEGQMPLLLSDYKVPVPSQLGGAITMQDEVKVWIALRARARVGGTK